jgi:hypothetical protein
MRSPATPETDCVKAPHTTLSPRRSRSSSRCKREKYERQYPTKSRSILHERNRKDGYKKTINTKHTRRNIPAHDQIPPTIHPRRKKRRGRRKFFMVLRKKKTYPIL